MKPSEDHTFTNHLIRETSPYLLQHAHNPVDWYPWGEKAFLKAKKESKLIVISIGYSACHWCHVMERQSFENETIAAVMNDHFVSVKVDREERPDIDQVYMAAIQLITGGGGWPLNCFALPDGSPVFGGTYFTPKKWLDLLKAISTLFKEDPGKVKEHAANLKKGIHQTELVELKLSPQPLVKKDMESFISSWKRNFDTLEGGHKGAPKFPLPDALQALLSYYYYTKDREIYDHVMRTLDKMAMGGIYDHVGGGFARYATDNLWKIPHFEKMLYDNGQLVSIYCQGFRLTGKERYRKVVFETLDFVSREMTSGEGGFFSSLDADSEGIEGKYYVWDYKEIITLLGKHADRFTQYYHIHPEGNWEQTNILFNTMDPEPFASQHSIPLDEFLDDLKHDQQILLEQRNGRIKPGRDDKILTSWNALMQKAYVDAFRVFGEPRFLDIALRNANFIKNHQLSDDSRLNRNFKDGKSTINGFLDDYALQIKSWIGFYEVTFDEQWLILSRRLMDHAIDHFYDKLSGMFFYTSDLDPPLVARKMELRDNVIPASNSDIAHGLYGLGKLFDKKEYVKMSEQMIVNMKPAIGQSPGSYSNWIRLMIRFIFNPHEVVLAGPEAIKFRQQLDEHFLPDIIFAGSMSDSRLPLLRNRFVPGKSLIYVCRENVCKTPGESVPDALERIE
jgi:uncharacterized protein YyaL (SSP411 family)